MTTGLWTIQVAIFSLTEPVPVLSPQQPHRFSHCSVLSYPDDGSSRFLRSISMQLANWSHKTTVVAGGQERVSVASQGLCFMCIVQRHDLMSGRDREPNRRPSDGHHARTHTHTIQRLSVRPRRPEVRGTSWYSTCSAVTVPCKLTTFFDTKYCLFLLAPKRLFKNALQTRDKFTFTNFRYELRKRSSAQNELQDDT